MRIYRYSAQQKYKLTTDDICQLMMMFEGWKRLPNKPDVLARLTSRGLYANGKLTPKGRAVCAELAGVRVLPEPERVGA